jgi:predicted nucleic acid-binding protein
MLFDTEFLIRYAGQRGRAQKIATEKFEARHLDAPLYTSRVCWSEFAEGCVLEVEVHAALTRFTVIEIDAAVAWHASRIARLLLRTGRGLGDNDVWIAATALVYGLPLVSRNLRHFSRVPGLTIAEY